MAKKKKEEIKPNEPVWDLSEPPTQEEFRLALAWYPMRATDAEMRHWLLEGLKKDHPSNKKLQKFVKSLPEVRHRMLGVLYRMKSNGYPILEPECITFKEAVAGFIESAKGETDDTEETETVNIQARITEKVNRFLGELDGISDDIFITEKLTREEFVPYDWMLENEVKPLHAGKISAHFRNELANTIGILECTDKSILEYYEGLPEGRLLNMAKFYADIIRDADRLSANVKAARKPRKKKAITAAKQVGKMKFKTRDDEYKIQSINPESIVGSAQLWVFNTKTRKVGVYNAEDASGLSVKGCTVRGFNLNTSVAKKARKPHDVIGKVLSGGKIVLRKVLDDMKAKESKLNGRINADTVLLRVVN